MKKYIVPFLFGASLILCSCLWGVKSTKSEKANAYKVYVTSLDEAVCNDCEIVDLGFCFELSSNKEIVTKGTEKTLGESKVFLCKEKDVNRILWNVGFKVKDKYQIDNILVFEGKDNCGSRIQAAFSLGKLTVGSPVIFGCY